MALEWMAAPRDTMAARGAKNIPPDAGGGVQAWRPSHTAIRPLRPLTPNFRRMSRT